MATTGELPPSARAGQAFIHDPKVADVTEVKAQIKLRFRDVRRQPCVVTRSFQLAQKSGGKLEKKDLDQVIQTLDEKTGERVSVSRKCADINATVPDMMGVSKAILENVVFVHQEDSNWPLGEAATLKKKFDEIFSATKYTKALEHINKLKKEQTQKIKEFRLIKEKLKVQKDHAVKLRARREENSKAATELGEQMGALNAQIKDADDQIARCDDELAEMRGRNERRGQIEARREAIVAETARRRAALENELTDATEDLQRLLAEFNDTIDETRAKVKEEERAVSDLALTAKAYKDKREVAMKRHGKLAAEADAHAKRVADRASFLRGVVARHPDLGPLPACLSLENVRTSSQNDDALVGIAEMTRAANEMRARATARLDALRAAAESTRAKHRGEDDAFGARADAANRELAAAEESVRLRAETRDATRVRAEHLADEIGSSAVSEAHVADLERRADEAQREFEERRAANAGAATAEELEKRAEALASLDRRLAKLRQEQDLAAVAGENATKVRLKREELFAKEEAVKSLLESRAGRFADVFGGEPTPPPERIKERLRAVVDARVAVAEAARRDASAAAVAADSAAAATRAAQGALARAKAEAAEAERRAEEDADALAGGASAPAPPRDASASGGPFGGYEARVSEIESRLTAREADLTVLGNLTQVYTSFAQSANEHRACPVCQQSLADVAAFTETVRQTVESVPAQEATARAEAASLRETRARLQRLAPVAARHATLVTKTIPEAETAVVAAEEEAARARAAAAAAEEAFEVASSDHAAAASLVEDADAATRLAAEAEALRAAVASLERSFAPGSSTQQSVPLDRPAGTQQTVGTQRARAQTARSVTEIGADVEDAELRRAALEREREALARRKERQDQELLSLERQARDLREDRVRVSAQAERRAELMRELEEIKRGDAAAAAEAARLEAERAPRRAARDALAREREAARAAARAAEAEADAAVRDLQRDVDALESAERPIAEYVAGGKAGELEKTAAEMSLLGERAAACEEKLATHEEARRRAHELVQSREKYKRSLEDNLAVRAGQEEEARLALELDACAAPDPEAFAALEEAQRRRARRRDELRLSCAESQGRVKNHREAMSECARELNDPELRGVDVALSKQVLELKTFEMTASDLDRYHGALDRALMAFHASKMSDINKVVRELWQRTYRGQDIDYIQIRSDAGSASGATGRSSYNYRVCMVVGDAELEMRGRCSAGQKVLACLIIRLALAETFCLNCGILALDEPTTNLDAPNSDALARSLCDIMHARRDQENFQLIVITHDMHFAQVLGQREHADYYWRITKDDNQHSHIECENIYE
jgi:DNA repair protein RAD50